MSLYSSVEQAVNNAVPAPATGPVFPISEDYAKYAGAPDLEPIHLNPTFTDEAHAAYTDVDEPHGLTALVDAYGDIGGMTVSHFEESVSHEYEHWEAAQRLGATAGRFGIRFAYGERADFPGCNSYSQLFLQVHSLHTTKIGLAILATFPEKPSEGDMGAVRNMGYRDVDDIAQRAQHLNDQGVLLGDGRPYPLPRRKSS